MRLPVLMYHDITTDIAKVDFLTILVNDLEQQLQYIRLQGYNTISLRQFHQYLTAGAALPPKPILLTFDDGYKSNLNLLYPLLKKYNFKAGIFLVTSFVQAAVEEEDKYLKEADLKQMDPDYVDFGYHSFNHSSYAKLSSEEAEADIALMKAGFDERNIPIVPLFAYPYGASPRKEAAKIAHLQNTFRQYGIHGAFRIGNRLCRLPVTRTYQIQRIDIRGIDSLRKFKLILKLGRKLIL